MMPARTDQEARRRRILLVGIVMNALVEDAMFWINHGVEDNIGDPVAAHNGHLHIGPPIPWRKKALLARITVGINIL